MKNDSKDNKRGSPGDHVRAHKPSLTAHNKSIDAILPFADEAKEDEQVQKECGDHKAGQRHNITYHVSSKEVVVEHEELAPPTHPGAVAVGGSGYARSSSENERFLYESYGIGEQPLAIHGVEEGQHQQEAITMSSWEDVKRLKANDPSLTKLSLQEFTAGVVLESPHQHLSSSSTGLTPSGGTTEGPKSFQEHLLRTTQQAVFGSASLACVDVVKSLPPASDAAQVQVADIHSRAVGISNAQPPSRLFSGGISNAQPPSRLFIASSGECVLFRQMGGQWQAVLKAGTGTTSTHKLTDFAEHYVRFCNYAVIYKFEKAKEELDELRDLVSHFDEEDLDFKLSELERYYEICQSNEAHEMEEKAAIKQRIAKRYKRFVQVGSFGLSILGTFGGCNVM